MLTCTVVLVLGCNWPYLAVVKHVNKRTELNRIIFIIIIIITMIRPTTRQIRLVDIYMARKGELIKEYIFVGKYQGKESL
jgi:hypothetical protein